MVVSCSFGSIPQKNEEERFKLNDYFLADYVVCCWYGEFFIQSRLLLCSPSLYVWLSRSFSSKQNYTALKWSVPRCFGVCFDRTAHRELKWLLANVVARRRNAHLLRHSLAAFVESAPAHRENNAESARSCSGRCCCRLQPTWAHEVLCVFVLGKQLSQTGKQRLAPATNPREEPEQDALAQATISSR